MISFGDVDQILPNGGHRQDCHGDPGLFLNEADKVGYVIEYLIQNIKCY